MSDMFKEDFKGTGSLKDFVDEANKLFSAANNIKVTMPVNYSGAEPTMAYDGTSLVFDMGDALIFTLNNVVWNLTGTADFVSHSVEVVNGQLVINVEADDIP